MRSLLVLAFLVAGTLAFADPVVDGQVAPGEYAHTLKLLGGKVLVSYQPDSAGGLSLAVQAQAKGYVGVGIGSRKMNGATIFLGVRQPDGNLAYSEETGKGHDHNPSGDQTADQHALADQQGWLTVEVHVPKDNLVLNGSVLSYIVAYSDSADLATWHGFFNKASGTVDLSK